MTNTTPPQSRDELEKALIKAEAHNQALQMMMQQRSAQTFGELVDAMNFAVMAAQNGDQGAKAALTRLVDLFDAARAMKSNISIPHPGQRPILLK